jgi:hypothetical protein
MLFNEIKLEVVKKIEMGFYTKKSNAENSKIMNKRNK